MALDFSISASERGRGASNVKWNLTSDVGGEATLKELIEVVRVTQVRVTQDVLEEELSRGFPKDYVEITDGRKGKPFQAVKPFGRINILAKETVSEFVRIMFEQVIQLSKVVTGQYIQSHVLLYNGKGVATSLSQAIQWAENIELKTGDVIRLLNTAPYARRLELLGVTSRGYNRKTGKSKDKKRANRGIIVRKPNGAYRQAYRKIRNRFKGSGKLQFKFVPGGEIGGLTGGGRRTFKPKVKGQQGRPYLYPSLVWRVDAGGVQ
jgi:hypothetical protein